MTRAVSKKILSAGPSWSTEYEGWELPTTQIESHKQGYPQFSALISAHDQFLLCRKFARARARLLLLKQDKLTVLTNNLDKIDREERHLIFLGKSRCDTNADRAAILAEIETRLEDYDSFLERTSRIMSLEKPSYRDVLNLQSWVSGTGALDRDETAFLGNRQELICLVSPKDEAMTKLEAWVEDILIRLYGNFRDNPGYSISSDSNVYVYNGILIRRLARIALLMLIVFLLLSPVVICNLIGSLLVRIVVITISTTVLLSVISALMSVRTIELIFAGATYATLLIVFVSGTT